MKNIVAATFQPGYTTAKVLGLWQYDYGQILRIQGLELPDAVEIHFSLQEKGGESERQVGLTRDGVTEVAVPNSYLENAGTSRDYSIYAFLYISDGKSGNTEYKITMYVQSRPKPKDPETPEDPKDDPFGKTIEAVNKAMKSAQASAEAAADSAKSASESATQAEKSAAESQESAKAAATSEKAAATSATAAAESEKKARESATAACSTADQAGKSATAAAESATTATQQAQSAERSATDASGSAESASQSAETAKTAADAAGKSVSSAQQASRSAAESASTATAAVQTATTAAGNAAESATTANQSAETAGQKATAAETSASNAAESATAAEKSATAAGDSASAAKVSETAATASAVTATEQAEKINASAGQIEKNKADVTSLKEDTATLQKRQNVLAGSETGSLVTVDDAFAAPLCGLTVYGKSTQDGTPTPDAPVPIVSAGDGGTIAVTLSDGNGKTQTLTLPTPNGLPGIHVTSGGNYTDQNGQQWVCDEVDLERGVKVQRVNAVDLSTCITTTIVKFAVTKRLSIQLPIYGRDYKTEALCNKSPFFVSFNKDTPHFYVDKTNVQIFIPNDAKNPEEGEYILFYTLFTPIETPLTSDEIAAYKALTAYAPDTVVQASDGAGIKLDYQRDVNLVVKNLEDAMASMTTT